MAETLGSLCDKLTIVKLNPLWKMLSANEARESMNTAPGEFQAPDRTTLTAVLLPWRRRVRHVPPLRMSVSWHRLAPVFKGNPLRRIASCFRNRMESLAATTRRVLSAHHTSTLIGERASNRLAVVGAEG